MYCLFLVYFAQQHDASLTSNASNHRSRALVPTTKLLQCCLQMFVGTMVSRNTRSSLNYSGNNGTSLTVLLGNTPLIGDMWISGRYATEESDWGNGSHHSTPTHRQPVWMKDSLMLWAIQDPLTLHQL